MAARDWIIVIVLGIGWGASFFFNEILLREIGPLSVSMGRVSLGAVACWVYVLASGRRVPFTAALGLPLLFFGAVQYAVPLAVYPLAQEYITGGVAGIVNAMMPIMVVIVSHLWPGGERATLAKSMGALFGFAGIVVLALPTLRQGGGVELWAVMFTLLAPVCYGIALNFIRRFRGIDPATLAALALTAGTVLITPVALAREGVPQITRVETWASLAVIGFVLTGVSFIVIYNLIPRIGATNASTVTFVAPVSAVFLGALILGEEVRLEHLLGMMAIFAGLVLIDGRFVVWARGVRRDHQPKG